MEESAGEMLLKPESEHEKQREGEELCCSHDIKLVCFCYLSTSSTRACMHLPSHISCLCSQCSLFIQ